MPRLINWTLIGNPWNWLIVVLMLLLAGFVLDTAATWWTQHNTKPEA